MKSLGRRFVSCIAAGMLFAVANAGASERDAADVPAATAPDNTGKNVRDRDGMMPTPTDQSNDPADVAVTRQIRQSITADESLGIDARNVKVITAGGVVTLRGPVADAREKSTIDAIARRTTGVKQVHNQLEVARTDADD
jgi:osmotically-inducible protein OsmY